MTTFQMKMKYQGNRMRTAHLFLPTTVSTRVTVTASKAGIPQLQNHSLDRLRITFLYFNRRRLQGRPSRPGRPPKQHRQSLQKREGTAAAAAFLGLLRVEISHENFITGASKARQGAVPPSLETFANYWVSQKNSDF